MAFRVGVGTTEFIVKLAAVVFALHLGLALLSNALRVTWYQTLTTTETSMIQGFVAWGFSILRDAWQRFLQVFFGA
jgi:hypothetical protein